MLDTYMQVADLDDGDMGEGGFVDTPGWYRVRLEDLSDRDDKNVFDCRVVAGPWKGGKIWVQVPIPETTDDEKKARGRLTSIGIRLGLTTKAEVEAAKVGRGGVDIQWPQAIGREYWVRLVEKTVNGKKGGWPEYMPFYPLNDPRVPENSGKGAGKDGSEGSAPPSGSDTGSPPKALTNADFNDF